MRTGLGFDRDLDSVTLSLPPYHCPHEETTVTKQNNPVLKQRVMYRMSFISLVIIISQLNS